jgi:hypothetical protein
LRSVASPPPLIAPTPKTAAPGPVEAADDEPEKLPANRKGRLAMTEIASRRAGDRWFQWLLRGREGGDQTIRVLRSGEPVAVNRFVTSLRMIGPRVLAPAMVVVVGLGIWMVVQSDAWGFGQT